MRKVSHTALLFLLGHVDPVAKVQNMRVMGLTLVLRRHDHIVAVEVAQHCVQIMRELQHNVLKLVLLQMYTKPPPAYTTIWS